MTGYIDKKGDWIFKPTFSEVNKFSDGKGLVLGMYNNHLRWSFISRP
ncbi:WG repeat-containing protein [Chryseobacterium sp. BIGb0232]